MGLIRKNEDFTENRVNNSCDRLTFCQWGIKSTDIQTCHNSIPKRRSRPLIGEIIPSGPTGSQGDILHKYVASCEL